MRHPTRSSCVCDETRWLRALTRRRLVAAGAGAVVALGAARPPLLAAEATPAAGDAVALPAPELGALANGSFVHPLVEVYGDVAIGPGCFVAATTILYAAAGRALAIGASTNCQDNAYLLARDRDLSFATEVSIAHQAAITDSEVGRFTFFGFRARVANARIGEGAMVLHNTLVEGVEVPPGRRVDPGVRVTSQADADALPPIVADEEAFKRGVQEVNHAFAEAYSALYREGGRAAVEGVVANPPVPFNPVATRPSVGSGLRLGEMAQIVGDVCLGDGARLGQRCAVRADEGTPIVVGRRARLGNRVTMHALEFTRIDVGDNLYAGDEVVIHGPVTIGHNAVIEDGAVVFRATLEDHVTVRAGATVAGNCLIREGSIVPEGAVVLTQADADALPRP